MRDRHDVTVPMEQDLVDEIDDELTYGDSRAEFVRSAIREKLARDRSDTTADGGDETLTA